MGDDDFGEDLDAELRARTAYELPSTPVQLFKLIQEAKREGYHAGVEALRDAVKEGSGCSCAVCTMWRNRLEKKSARLLGDA